MKSLNSEAQTGKDVHPLRWNPALPTSLQHRPDDGIG